MSPSSQEIFIDPEISKKKFQAELEHFFKIKHNLRKKGWILEEYEYPLVRVTFINRYIHPRVSVCTVDLEFDNFDVLPPSLKFRDPFSLEYGVDIRGLQDQIAKAQQSGLQVQPAKMKSVVRGSYIKDGKTMDIILNHPECGRLFLCMPGVREYHSHPEHTNDPWDNHRKQMSRGILTFLLEQIDTHCIEPMKALPLNFPLSVFPVEHYHIIK